MRSFDTYYWHFFRSPNSGLDLLLRRIAAGVRPSGKKPAAPAAKPAEPPPSLSTLTQRRCNENKDKRGDNDADADDDDDTEDTDEDDDGDDDRENIITQLPRPNPSHISETGDGEGEGALQTTTVPGKPNLLDMVGASNQRGVRCGRSQGSARKAGASNPQWPKVLKQVGYVKDGVSDEGRSAPTATAVACCLLSARGEEERVAEPAHKQRAGPKQHKTTAGAPPAAAGGRAVKGARRALFTMNREPVKMSGSVPSVAAFGVHQSKPIFRRATAGEALSGSGDKENRLGE